jgi:hypothetical protein
VRFVSRRLLDEAASVDARNVGEPPFRPIAHHADPNDPTLRTALCGAEILGIPSSGEYEVCEECWALFEMRGRSRGEKPQRDIEASPLGDGRYLLVVNHPVAREWVEARLPDTERDGDGFVLEGNTLDSILGELFEAHMP